MGKYADKIAHKNRNLSPMQIRANKCQRSKARNAARKEHNVQVQEERLKAWRSLSTKEQLASLAARRGNSTKQVKRIKAAATTFIDQSTPLSRHSLITLGIQ